MNEYYTNQNLNVQNDYIKKQQDKFFKKNANHTALALILDIVFQNVLAFVFEIIFLLVFIAVKTASGDFSLDSISNLMSNEWLVGEGQWVYIAFVLLLSHIFAALICMNRTGVKLKSVINGYKNSSFGLVVKCTAVMFALNFIGSLIYVYINYLFNLVGIEATGNDALTMPQSSVVAIIFYFFAVCIVAPIGEELLFRGAILHSLKRYGTVFAAVISSILFGLFHMNFQQMPMAFLLGLVFSYATIKTGSIKTSVLLHFINNTFSCIEEALYTFMPDKKLLIATFDYGILAICIVVSAIILIANFRKIKFKSDSPESLKSDNIISIDKPYLKYFSSVFVILAIILCAIYIIVFSLKLL